MTWITLTERDFFLSSQATLMAFFFEAVCAVRSLFSSDGELGENWSVHFTLCVKMWKCLHPHTCSLRRWGGVLG